jgi:hypothetical protein
MQVESNARSILVLATRHAVGNRRRRHGVGARIAMLTSAGRVQRCRAPVMDPVLLPRSSGTYASSTVRRPSRKKARCRYVGYRRSSNQANDSGMPATGGMLCGGRLTVGSGAVSPAASYSSRGHLALNGSKNGMRGMASDRRSVATFNSLGVKGTDAHQPRLRWARMAEMMAVVASALPPPKWARPAKPCVSASNCR